MRRYSCLAVLLLMAGCTTTQLTHNTLNMSSALQSVMSEETLDNLGAFAQNRYQLPSEGIVSGGTAQVTNTVNPSVAFPLTNMFASVFGGSSPGHTTTYPAATSTLSATATWQLNFNITPIIDTTTLRNLAVLYRTVLDTSTVKNDDGLFQNYQPPQTYATDNRLVPDPYYLSYSNCVFCVHFNHRDLRTIKVGNLIDTDALRSWLLDKGEHWKETAPLVSVNPSLATQWLFYKGSNTNGWLPAVANGTFPAHLTLIGSSHGYDFAIADDVTMPDGRRAYGADLFSKFVLLTLPIPVAPDRSKTSLDAAAGSKTSVVVVRPKGSKAQAGEKPLTSKQALIYHISPEVLRNNDAFITEKSSSANLSNLLGNSSEGQKAIPSTILPGIQPQP